MTTVLDLLADGSRDDGIVRVLPAGHEMSTAALWALAGAAANWIGHRVEQGGAVAAVLSTSLESFATIVGAWRAGVTLASLPRRARGTSKADYRDQLSRMCHAVGATWLVADAGELATYDGVVSNLASFEASAEGGPPARPDSVGELVQFTSGSTGQPKGIRLSLDSVAANVAAALDVLDLGDEVRCCSWLPLSHDMGLIGMLLGPWSATGGRWCGRGEMTFLPPTTFVTRPTSFLQACSTHRATLTAAPNFAFDILGRRVGEGLDLDLSALQVCIVGAEPVWPDTLRTFAATAAPYGFRHEAFSPAYGLAEATLAVSILPPREAWTSVWIDGDALAEGTWALTTPGAGVEFMGNGPPIPSMSVRVHGDGAAVGELEIKGPSLLTEYVGTPDTARLADGWFRTNDVGMVHAGQVFVLGRADDTIVVAGRNLFAPDLERTLVGVPGIRSGNWAAVSDGRGRYAVFAERRPGTRISESMSDICAEIRARLTRCSGIGPSAVRLVSPGAFPITPSGKVQRSKVRREHASGRLAVDFSVEFPAPS